jgi:hypothetical protein
MVSSESYPVRARKEWTSKPVKVDFENGRDASSPLTLKPFSLYVAVRVQRGILRWSCNA